VPYQNLCICFVEFLDELSVTASNQQYHLGLDEVPTLFIELHGSAMSVQEQIEMVSEIAQSNGALKFEWESDHEKRAKLWKARHEWWYGGLAMQPGKKVGLLFIIRYYLQISV